jgi:hypothetical protein
MQIDQDAPTFWYGIKQLHRANLSSISLSLSLSLSEPNVRAPAMGD